jgi:hypothetical protein
VIKTDEQAAHTSTLGCVENPDATGRAQLLDDPFHSTAGNPRLCVVPDLRYTCCLLPAGDDRLQTPRTLRTELDLDCDRAPVERQDREIGAVEAFPAVEGRAGDRPALNPLDQNQLALGDDRAAPKLFGQELAGRRAAKKVIKRAGRHCRLAEAEARICKASGCGTQKARLQTKELEALDQTSLDTARDPPIGRGAADAESGHDMVDRHNAVAGYIADEFAISVLAWTGFKNRGVHDPKTIRGPDSSPSSRGISATG